MALRGLGTDIVRMERLEASIRRTGEAFLRHVYAEEELRQAPPEGSPRRIEYLAGRWAVKEALAKALGCGISAQCRMCEVVTLDDQKSGQPRLTLRGAAAETAGRLGVRQTMVSIAHEHEYAVATVITQG